MELGNIFSQDFQKAMKRAARGTQKGSISESSSIPSSSNQKIVGKGINTGNFYFSKPKVQKGKKADDQLEDQVSA
jgi:hypothetical protein